MCLVGSSRRPPCLCVLRQKTLGLPFEIFHIIFFIDLRAAPLSGYIKIWLETFKPIRPFYR